MRSRVYATVGSSVRPSVPSGSGTPLRYRFAAVAPAARRKRSIVARPAGRRLAAAAPQQQMRAVHVVS